MITETEALNRTIAQQDLSQHLGTAGLAALKRRGFSLISMAHKPSMYPMGMQSHGIAYRVVRRGVEEVLNVPELRALITRR